MSVGHKSTLLPWRKPIHGSARGKRCKKATEIAVRVRSTVHVQYEHDLPSPITVALFPTSSGMKKRAHQNTSYVTLVRPRASVVLPVRRPLHRLEHVGAARRERRPGLRLDHVRDAVLGGIRRRPRASPPLRCGGVLVALPEQPVRVHPLRSSSACALPLGLLGSDTQRCETYHTLAP